MCKIATHDPEPYEFVRKTAEHGPEPYDFTGRNAIHGSKPYGLQSMTVNPMKSLTSTRKSMAPNTMNSKTKLQSMRYEFSTVHDEYCNA